MKKRILSAVMVLAMVLTMLPVSVSAADTAPVKMGDISFRASGMKSIVTDARKEGITNVMSTTVIQNSQAVPNMLDTYEFKVTDGSGKEVSIEAKSGSSLGYTFWWTLPEDASSGTYTVKLLEKDGSREVTSKTVKLVSLTFHKGDSAPFTDHPEQETVKMLAKADDYLSLIGCPEVKVPEGSDSVGWNTQNGAAEALKNVPSDDADLYPVFFTAKKESFEIREEGGSSKLEKVTPSFTDSVSSFTYDIVNTGNTDLTYKTVSYGTNPYITIEFKDKNGGPLTDLRSGEAGKMIISRRPDALKGTYAKTIWVYFNDMRDYFILEATVPKSLLEIRPDSLTKEYHQPLTQKDLTFKVKQGGEWVDPPADAGAEFSCEGLDASAEPKDYTITFVESTSEDYSFSCTENGTLTVKKQVPETAYLEAGEIAPGSMLADSKFNAKFTDRYTQETVEGTVTWNESTDPGPLQEGSYEYSYLFTPNDETHYEKVSGRTTVTVSRKEDPGLALSPDSKSEVTYDGSEHGLKFTSGAGEENISVQYAPKGTDEWSEQLPVDAGTYDVSAASKETDSYASETMQAELVILPMEAQLQCSPQGKVYDGTDEAHASFKITNLCQRDEGKVEVAYSGRYADGKDAGSFKKVTITATGFTGDRAGNYTLPEETSFTGRTFVTKAPATLTLKSGISLSKTYGEAYSLTVASFDAEGLLSGDTLDPAEVVISCAGFERTAKPGNYDLLISGHGSNYDARFKTTGTTVGYPFAVKKGQVEVWEDTVRAGDGMKGSLLRDISLTGEAVNKANPDQVLTGTWQWVEPDTVLGDTDTQEARWEFIYPALDAPEDDELKDCFEPCRQQGTIQIRLQDRKPIGIEADAVTSEFTGKATAYAGSIRLTPASASYTVKYRQHEDAAHSSDLDVSTFSDQAPVNAGTYDVLITASKTSSFTEQEKQTYADESRFLTHLTISRAEPVLPSTQKTTVVEEGTTLLSIPEDRLPWPDGIAGEGKLKGTFEWAAGDAVIKSYQTYGFTFIPDSTNYREVSGSVRFRTETSRNEPDITVYNLPSTGVSDGISSYIVFGLAGSGLETADTVSIYADLSSDPVAAQEASSLDLAQKSFTVKLPDGTLNPEGGTLYIRITRDGTETYTGAVEYSPVVDFAAEPVSVAAGTTADVIITPDSLSYAVLSETLTADQSGCFSADSGAKTVTGIKEGSGQLTISVTFQHPDPDKPEATVSVTHQVAVTVTAAPPHQHSMQHHQENPATCTRDGVAEYYECTGCGKLFSDAQGNTPLNAVPAVKAPGHSLETVPAKDPTCGSAGNVEYRRCTRCGTIFQADGVTETTLEAVSIPALNHENVEHVRGVEPTYEADGNIEYWHCPNCGKYFLDAALKEEVSREQTILPRLVRTLKAAVYNLPDEQYAVVDAEASGLSRGETVYFYVSRDAAEPTASGTAGSGDLTLKLSGLKPEGGILFAKIGTDGEPAEVPYHACPELTVSDSVSVKTGESISVTAAVRPADLYSVKTASWSGGRDIFSVDGTSLTARVTGLKVGSAELTVTAATAHPDPARSSDTVTLTGKITVHVIAADHVHSGLVKHDAVPHTCTEDGTLTWWECPSCGTRFSDETGRNVLNDVIDPKAHTDLKYVEAKEPTAEAEGSIAHWYCGDCGRYFKDEAAEEEITKEDTVLEKKPSSAAVKPLLTLSVPATARTGETVTATASLGRNPDVKTDPRGILTFYLDAQLIESSGTSAVLRSLAQGTHTVRVIFTPAADETVYGPAEASAVISVSTPGGGGGGGGGSSSGSSGGTSRPDSNVTTDHVTDPSTGSGTSTQTTVRPQATQSGDTASAAVDKKTGDELVEQAEKNHSDTVVVAPDVPQGTAKTQVTIPGQTVKDLGDRTDASLRVETPAADITIPNDTLSRLDGSSSLTVSTEETDGSIRVEVKQGSQVLDSIPGGILADMPCSTCSPSTVAVLVYPDGTREVVRTSIADEDTGKVSVPLDGSATLEIIDNHRDFSDVAPDAWYADVVDFASSHELMNGTAPSTFSPESVSTRATIAMLLYNLEKNPEADEAQFPDTAQDAWYTDAVTWAAEHGVVSGYSDGTFGPDDTITREQMAMILCSYARYKGVDVTAQAGLDSFSDASSVSGWADAAMRWAVAEGLILGTGDGQLNPGGSATRSQVAALLNRFCRTLVR